MPKLCNRKDCTYNQFGGGYCRNHQWCRLDKKVKNNRTNPFKTLKRKPIRKVSKKQSKLVKERKVLQEKDWLFYLEIWDEREHVCFETGEPIFSEPLTLFFHHILDKGIERYEKYRHCKWNIVLVTWVTHDTVHKNIDLCPKIKELRDKLIKKTKDGTIPASRLRWTS